MADSLKSAQAFRTISEVSEELGLPQHVLRFWELKFPAIKPLKRGGNRRYYRPQDVELLRAINRLLYTDGYTIKGVQKLIATHGPKALMGAAPSLPVAPVPDASASADADIFVALRTVRDRLAEGLRQVQGAR